MGSIMSTMGHSSFVFTSVVPAKRVLPPLVITPRSSIPTMSLNSMSQVVKPPVHISLADASGDMVIGIPSIPIVPSSFTYTTQSGPVGS